MSHIYLYLDEDAQRQALVQALRNAGVDVVTTLEANNSARVDEEQLIWAIEQERVIYSFNVGDFCRLHTAYMEQGMEHRGIILAESPRHNPPHLQFSPVSPPEFPGVAT